MSLLERLFFSRRYLGKSFCADVGCNNVTRLLDIHDKAAYINFSSTFQSMSNLCGAYKHTALQGYSSLDPRVSFVILSCCPCYDFSVSETALVLQRLPIMH
jgi:hypothetical protein